MAFQPPEKLPQSFEELDAACARVYQEGVEFGMKQLNQAAAYEKGVKDGKAQLRIDIREFLTKVFFGIRGRDRRANPEDPKIQAIREIMERLYTKFEEGTL